MFIFKKKQSNHVCSIIFFKQLLRSTYEECKDAFNNAEDVKVCPRSKEEWDIAARRKNCSKQAVLAEGKNFTIKKKQLEYHCLINAFRNKFLEVCEPAKTIFGNARTCVFFNSLWILEMCCRNKLSIRSG